MKNLTNDRDNRINITFRSLMASSLIALSMMSCSKENIEPATVNTLENARVRSNQVIDSKDAKEMLHVNFSTYANQSEILISISNQALITVTSTDPSARQSSQYRLSQDQYHQLLSLISNNNNADQAYTASNKNAFKDNQAEGYTASNKKAYLHRPTAEGYHAANNQVFIANQSEAYTATNNKAYLNRANAESYTASNSFAYRIASVELRPCSACNPNVFSSNGNEQERIQTDNFIADLDRIIDLSSLINEDKNSGIRN